MQVNDIILVGEIRYHIAERVNAIRELNQRTALYIHEGNSDAVQRHAQHVLEEMLKHGLDKFDEINHLNPFYHGEYKSENIGISRGDVTLKEHVERIILSFEHEDGKTHWDNMIDEAWHHVGTDVAYDNNRNWLVLVQRFS